MVATWSASRALSEGGKGVLGGRDEEGCEQSQLGASAGYASDFGFFGHRGGSMVLGEAHFSLDMHIGEGEGGWKN